MSRTNINALLKMVCQYLSGEIGRTDFVLDFPYEIEKRFRKAVAEDEDYAEMIYDCLIVDGTDKESGLSDDEFRELIQKQYDKVIDGIF